MSSPETWRPKLGIRLSPHTDWRTRLASFRLGTSSPPSMATLQSLETPLADEISFSDTRGLARQTSFIQGRKISLIVVSPRPARGAFLVSWLRA